MKLSRESLRTLLASLLALAAACHGKAPRATQLHCFRYSGKHEKGPVNPLLIGRYLCYDQASDCEREKLDPAAECIASGPPHWACFWISGKGPSRPQMEKATTCYPNPAMCEASREVPAEWSEDTSFIRGPCTAKETVYCTTIASGATVICNADARSCETGRDLASSMLPGQPPSTPCAARRSAE
jgi:hypothetical protein